MKHITQIIVLGVILAAISYHSVILYKLKSQTEQIEALTIKNAQNIQGIVNWLNEQIKKSQTP